MNWNVVGCLVFMMCAMFALPDSVKRLLLAAILGFIAFGFLIRAEPKLAPEWWDRPIVQNDSTTVQNAPDGDKGGADE